MAYGRVKLIDPSAVLPPYSWDINYGEESDFGQRRNLEIYSNTSGLGFVLQQGADDPMQISVSGKALKRSQHQWFVRYFKASREHTIVLQDFEEAMFEVMMTAYQPRRIRAAANPRGRAEGNNLHTYDYTMEFMVINVLSGDWTLV